MSKTTSTNKAHVDTSAASLATKSEHVLKCRGLRKSYRSRAVVDGVDIDVSPGEIVGLLGPNGAGKTTTFYMVVGLIRPDAGFIHLGASDITSEPMYMRARQGITYLPQEASVFRKLSVQDNILAILETLPHYRGNKSAQKERMDELISDLDLGKVALSKAYSLSGGERRRVEIARALACSPTFMLLDEPFAGIDPIIVGDLQATVRRLSNRGIGVLITDHSVRETLGICTRAYIMSDGKIIENGSPQEIAGSEIARRFYLGESFRL